VAQLEVPEARQGRGDDLRALDSDPEASSDRRLPDRHRRLARRRAHRGRGAVRGRRGRGEHLSQGGAGRGARRGRRSCGSHGSGGARAKTATATQGGRGGRGRAGALTSDATPRGCSAAGREDRRAEAAAAPAFLELGERGQRRVGLGCHCSRAAPFGACACADARAETCEGNRRRGQSTQPRDEAPEADLS
jgi:hypothetical protein